MEWGPPPQGNTSPLGTPAGAPKREVATAPWESLVARIVRYRVARVNQKNTVITLLTQILHLRRCSCSLDLASCRVFGLHSVLVFFPLAQIYDARYLGYQDRRPLVEGAQSYQPSPLEVSAGSHMSLWRRATIVGTRFLDAGNAVNECD